MDYTQSAIELLRRLHTHDMSQIETILLILIVNLPLPVEWRINIFMFLTNPHLPVLHIPFPHLSQFQFGLLGLVLIILSPLLWFILLYIVIVLINFLLPGLHQKRIQV